MFGVHEASQSIGQVGDIPMMCVVLRNDISSLYVLKNYEFDITSSCSKTTVKYHVVWTSFNFESRCHIFKSTQKSSTVSSNLESQDL